MDSVYLLVGCPASGKSFVAGHADIQEKFEYAHHDLFIGMTGDAYLKDILARRNAPRPILAEAPFSISQIKEPLEKAGMRVTPVFILAEPSDLQKRWDQRGNVAPKTRAGHLTRQNTYAERAKEWNAFRGTSSEVLEYLRRV